MSTTKAMFDRLRKEYEEKKKILESKIGRRVKHRRYLLDGVIVGTFPDLVGSSPMVMIKWDNGAKTSEFPHNIVFVDGD